VDSGSSKINQNILDTFSKGKKALSISDISRLSGHHRHTVARYLDNLVSSGKLEMRQHGQKKKYYLADIQLESSILNFSLHMLIILNMDLSIRWANDSFLKMVNTTNKAISNLGIEALHLDELFGPELVTAIRMVRPGETRSEEARICRDEKETIYLFTISAVSFFQDRPALVITGEDVTEKKTLQEAIRTSESNLRLITESVHDMIIRWETDGTISYVSPACELLTGYVSRELMGEKISEFIHPEDLPRFQNGSMEEDMNWSRLPSSFRFRTLKGIWVWFETTTTPRMSETGEVLDYISVWRDITAWLEAETKMALSEEKYRRLFEGAKDAIILMELTENLKHVRIREVNNLTCQLTGYTYQELLALSIPDIIPESKHEFLDEITKNFVQNEQGIFEIEIVRKDGTLVPVEVNAHLFYLQGKPVVLAITRDITERKRTETAIREAHQRLVEILEFLPDPVFVLDTEGRVTAWNRAMEELTGTKMEDVIGKGDFAYSVAFYHQKRPCLADYILNRDETILLRYNNPSIDGDRVTADVQTLHPVTKSRIWLWIKAAPIYGLDAGITGVIETLRDISDRKIMELEIRKQNAIFEAVSRAASDILQSAAFEDAALRTIGLIGEATSVGRVILLEKASQLSAHLIKSELEWNAKTGIAGRTRSPISMILKNEKERSVIEEAFISEKAIYNLVKDLRGDDRRIFETDGVKSLLLVPIKTSNGTWGVVGFLETRFERIWSRKEISALEIGSSLIGSALMRFEAGENLEKSEKQFRTLAQNIPGIVFRVSLAGSDMEFYNDHLESVTGYSAKELASGQISSLIPLIFPDDKQRVVHAKKESIKTGEPYEIEYRIIDKYGKIRIMSERGRPVADETGLIVSIDGIIQEIE
jgi:PAS domain S-box-containing protein